MIGVASITVMVAGLVVVVTASAVGWWRSGFLAALDLWTAAVLLRVAAEQSWTTIAVAAGVVAFRIATSTMAIRGHGIRLGR